MLIIVIGGICVVYLAAAQILEWMHHLELIKKRWPAAYKILMNPATRILLLFVVIGLFAEALREHRQQTGPVPGTPANGGTTVSGDCNGVNTGNGGKVDVNCADKNTSKSAK